MQLEHLITKLHEPPVHVLVEHLLLVMSALTITVSQDTPTLKVVLLLMIHCGMDKIVVDLSEHAVTLQTYRGSARSFLNLPLTTWSSVSVGTSLAVMRISPLTLLSSTYNELQDVVLL